MQSYETSIITISTPTANLRQIGVNVSASGHSTFYSSPWQPINIYPELWVYHTSWVRASVGAVKQSNDTNVSWQCGTGVYTKDLKKFKIVWKIDALESNYIVLDINWSINNYVKYFKSKTIKSSGIINWMAVGD